MKMLNLVSLDLSDQIELNLSGKFHIEKCEIK